MNDLLRRLFTPWRLKWYPRAAISALIFALLLVLMSDSGSKSFFGRLGGYFTEFYDAGNIVLSGRLDKLYAQNEQAFSQKDIALEKNAFVPFAYPPQKRITHIKLCIPFLKIPSNLTDN